ncbi:Nudix family hydrolase [Ectothiorhodospiraceae bacterium 2226]|nr:Nudix family hydrolase [Ectothiorhodospiraceae bacterium 2226]
MPNTAPDLLHVAAGAVFNARGEVLIAQRPPGKPYPGYWEFPGGKVEDGESFADALARELEEEVGIHVEQARPLLRVLHAYSDRTVLLDAWCVTRFSGVPHGREGQPVAWVSPAELERYRFPAANATITTAVRLPSLYLITGTAEGDGPFLRRLERLLQAGVRLIQYRQPGLASRDWERRARAAVTLCRRYGAALIVNGTPEQARELGAAGVHLNSERLMSLSSRPLGGEQWVGASCHDLAELQHAEAIGADFAVLSPIKPTPSHPGAPTLGLERLRELSDRVAIPVYALGGMYPADVAEAHRYGAQGIAVVTALWSDPRPADAVRAALAFDPPRPALLSAG